MPEVERPKALSTDAYKWSQKVGLQGCIKSVTLNRCTMQRHKWLSLQDAATLMADEAVTHRPQTTTIARTQSQQSVHLKASVMV